MSAAVASASRAISRTGSRDFQEQCAEPEVIGACLVYLGGLNYFFPVDEKCPIVSRVGTVLGVLHVTIEPFIAPVWASGTRDSSHFEAYEPPPVDKPEDQVFDFLDRTIEYRLTLREITDMSISTKKYSRLSLRYAFHREPSRMCGPFPVTSTDVRVTDGTSRHIVDITEPLVAYLTSSNLLVEVCAYPHAQEVGRSI